MSKEIQHLDKITNYGKTIGKAFLKVIQKESDSPEIYAFMYGLLEELRIKEN